MEDKFVFADGQDLSTLDSTGEVSDNIWDIEEDAHVDGQVIGYMNVLILATTNTGGDSGLIFEFRSSDSAAMATTPFYLGIIQILQSEIVAGRHFSIGVTKSQLKKYVSAWPRTVSESLDNATTVDIWFSVMPEEFPVNQLKNLTTGAA